MKLTNVIYFDDEDGSFVAEKFFINSEECSEEDYEEILDEFDNVNEINEDECDGNCDGCPNNKFKQEPEENQFLRVVTDAVNDTLEMFENPTTCDDCKAHALLDLVMLGVDGALQGCIGREEMLN